MLRIGYMSDLHTEFEGKGPSNPSGEWFALHKRRRELTREGHPDCGPLLDEIREQIDLLVVAGDTATPRGRLKGRSGIQYADRASQYLGVPVIVIAGNHEFYDGDMDEELAELRREAAATDGHVWFLEQDAVALDLNEERLHVMGCTLWTDFGVFGDVENAAHAASTGMTDFQDIRLGSEVFSPRDAMTRHRCSRVWIGEGMAAIRRDDANAKVLLVTHHAPSLRSVPEQLRNDVLTAAYASDLEEESAGWQPDVWMHGHLHGECDYHIGRTRVLSAARGYIGYGQGAEVFRPKIIAI